MKPVDTVVATSGVCPVCRNKESDELFALGSDRVVQCKSATCRMVFAISPPLSKAALYNAAYFAGGKETGGYQNYQAEMRSHTETFRRRLLATEKRLGGKGRLLDCGCAYGHLGHVARELGWDVYATDISVDAVIAATTEYGLKGFVSDMDHMPMKTESFDVITLYDVIEHVPDPVPILISLSRLLRPGGVLHITTPDVSSPSAHLLGKSWYHYKPGEHLLYFSRATLTKALTAAGFETLAMAPAPSHMTLHDVFIRLRRYSRPIANGLLKMASAAGMADKVIRLHIGEMQAWARPKRNEQPLSVAPHHAGGHITNTNYASIPESNLPVLNVICCPSCGGDLIPEPAPSGSVKLLRCDNCPETYEVRDRVPILFPGQGLRKAVGQ